MRKEETMKELTYLLEFTEPLLGTLAGDKELAKNFIASKAPEGPKADELETIDEMVEKSSTVFNRDDQGPFLWDYHIKGFFKDAIDGLINNGDHTKEELKKFRLTPYLYKKTIDKQLFVAPRKVRLDMPNGKETFFIERPLRAETMRGERVALARSEACPEGTLLSMTVTLLQDNLEAWVDMAMQYGGLRGIGQWRNAGFGRFSFTRE